MDMETKTDAQSKDQDLRQYKVTVEVGQDMTTNEGLRVSDDRNSLKAGVRGPTLLEDFALREKITHFDHERIPERVVHARGAGAHGYFQVYESMAQYTKAKFLQDPAIQTPVFVRFSTVGGSRGSADTARDVRGFAVKFYTEEGNYDLVGNNMPVFFIQDAIKFPDLIHSVKPEPHNEIPQASSAHDTFYDFISLTPESMHTLMWLMSDRAIPRSFRMMEGFGVHTFRLINAENKVTFVKFHWKPLMGVHSLVWDEAQKLAGKDPDVHRRDLWEAIDQGDFAEWEFGVQLLDEADEFKFDFDILDASKLWPEDLIPVRRIGKMTLNRNPDSYFAETEQVAFHTAHVVPGIDFTDDPLLAGRNFSYLDTQLTRLGGPNFAELPINRPIETVSNNQRDGHMRYTVNKGRVTYEPNSLNNEKPAPVPASQGGYATYPEKVAGPKVRERSESFNDHYGQARLFWNSMSKPEQNHIVSALQFELSKVETRAIRQRMLAHLAHINDSLASQVAVTLGEKVPSNGKVSELFTGLPPMALAGLTDGASAPTSAPTASGGLQRTSGLSMEESPKNSIKTRKVAIMVADGVAGAQVVAIKAALKAEGALPLIVAPHIGTVSTSDGGPEISVDKTYANSGSVAYDAFFVPGGKSVATLTQHDEILSFVHEGFKHGKAIAAVAEGVDLLVMANIGGASKSKSAPGVTAKQGVVTASGGTHVQEVAAQFITAMKQGRDWTRALKEEVPA